MPVTCKDTARGESYTCVSYGVSSMQGCRLHMEDTYICEKAVYAIVKEPYYQELDLKVGNNLKEENDPSECESNTELFEEDRKAIILNDTSLFAVFDGHRGKSASLYASNNFIRVLSCQPHFIRYAITYKKTKGNDDMESECLELLTKALKEAFLALDEELRKTQEDEIAESRCLSLNSGFRRSIFSSDSNDAGSTALVVILNPKWIVCANAGDCRAVLGRDKQEIIKLSQDHKPNNDNEKKRIFLAGGTVRWGRVDGDLSVSRGFGDFVYKNLALSPREQKITADPEICVVRRDDTIDEFVFIGCFHGNQLSNCELSFLHPTVSENMIFWLFCQYSRLNYIISAHQKNNPHGLNHHISFVYNNYFCIREIIKPQYDALLD